MAVRVNKYIVEYVVKEFVPGHGWFDSTTEETLTAARQMAKQYIKNGIAAKAVTRRTLNPAYKG